MDQARIQAQISKGLAKAASIIGASFVHYRPTTAVGPVLVGVGTISCGFDSSALLAMTSPSPPGHPFALLLADTSLLEAGDYLVGQDTYFVSRIQPLVPAWCVLCNVILDILDTVQDTAEGTNAYGGVTSASNSLIAQGWPMSMLAKNRGEQDVTKLPTDTRSAFFEIWLPSIPGVVLGLGLCLQDSSGQKYQIMSWENTAYGCKLLVGSATT